MATELQAIPDPLAPPLFGAPRAGLIYGRILDLMADVGHIAKDSVNKEQKFNYRSIDTVYNHVQPLLIKHRVFSAPGKILELKRETSSSKSGSTMSTTLTTIRYDFFTDDGSSVSVEVIGEGRDSGDKASNKAMSVAHKYALFQILAIPIASVDPDGHTPPHDNPDADETAPTAAPRDDRVTAADIKDIASLWKAQHSTGDRDKDQDAFYAWSIRVSGRPDFKPGRVAEWTRADLAKCLHILGVPE